jgi:hypothetical protein
MALHVQKNDDKRGKWATRSGSDALAPVTREDLGSMPANKQTNSHSHFGGANVTRRLDRNHLEVQRHTATRSNFTRHLEVQRQTATQSITWRLEVQRHTASSSDFTWRLELCQFQITRVFIPHHNQLRSDRANRRPKWQQGASTRVLRHVRLECLHSLRASSVPDFELACATNRSRRQWARSDSEQM